MTAMRRRGEQLEQALHAAVLEEIEAHGYAATTYEGVAARAATSKPVLYRRWPTKAAMVLAAISATSVERTAPLHNLPDTGHLAGDIAAQLRGAQTLSSDVYRLAGLGLLADLGPEDSDTVLDLLFAGAEMLTAPLVARARARGELGPESIPRAILDLPLDLARHDIMVRGGLTEDRIEAIAEQITAPLWICHSRKC